ncbi:MAG TPA: hypothetical protein VEV17_20835 [Bryobacteraceae bacterium]|nr:hypothetical protein [Bryobacteraceae bacterium]
MFSRLAFTTSFLAFALACTVHGQPAPARNPDAAKAIPRTPDGHPDLQGIWLNHYATPFERPKELEGRQLLTDEEVAELNRRAKKIFGSGTSDAAAPDAFFLAALRNVEQYKSAGATDSAERVTELVIDNRTSAIIDPPDGKLPALTEAGQRRRAAYGRSRSGTGNPSGPKDVAPGDRCITFGVPRVNGVYSAGLHGYYQIVQTRDHVLLFSENIHETRIIPMDGRPHLSDAIRGWSGDSRGRWENNTLVVDTTNFKAQLNSLGVSENFHLIERFTRVAPDEIRYEMTFDDPGTWTKPWTAMIRLKRTDERLYEFACHEGNELIMQTILSGNRPNQR